MAVSLSITHINVVFRTTSPEIVCETQHMLSFTLVMRAHCIYTFQAASALRLQVMLLKNFFVLAHPNSERTSRPGAWEPISVIEAWEQREVRPPTFSLQPLHGSQSGTQPSWRACRPALQSSPSGLGTPDKRKPCKHQVIKLKASNPPKPKVGDTMTPLSR